MPLYPALASTVAKTINNPASFALLIHSFRPFSRYSSPPLLGARLQRKRIRARSRLAQCIRAHRVRGQSRQISLLLFLRGPAQQRGSHQRVLHVHQHAHRRVHRRDHLHRQHRIEKRSARSAKPFRNLRCPSIPAQKASPASPRRYCCSSSIRRTSGARTAPPQTAAPFRGTSARPLSTPSMAVPSR